MDIPTLAFALPIPESLPASWKIFLEGGGVFMAFILLASVVAGAVILQRLFALRWGASLPPEMVRHAENLGGSSNTASDLTALKTHASESSSAFAHIVRAAFEMKGKDPATQRGGVEAVAREQIVGLQAGMPVLEVVITIAPLLGLLGTVSGLIGVFGVFGSVGAFADPDPSLIASGIAEALYTTIGGLAVAVPVVMAHSHLNKRIECMAARLEVLASHVIVALEGDEDVPVEVQPAPQPTVRPQAVAVTSSQQPLRPPSAPTSPGTMPPAPVRTTRVP